MFFTPLWLALSICFRICTEEEKLNKIAILGGGFLGTEISVALAQLNKQLPKNRQVQLVQIFFEEQQLATYIPKYLAKHVRHMLTSIGVEQLPGRLLSEVSRKGSMEKQDAGSCDLDAKLINISNEIENLEMDYLILATTRIDPDNEIAANSGLEIDEKNGGVVVSEALEAFRDLFVAGTAASYFNKGLGRRRVSEYDHAMNSGLVCATNMLKSGEDTSMAVRNDLIARKIRQYSAGDTGTESSDANKKRVNTKLNTYKHIPAFRCVLPELSMSFECVGEIDSRLKTVGVWLAKRDKATGQPRDESDFQRGIVYYLKNSRVVGVLCCNASECLENARNVLNEGEVIQDDAARQLKKKIKLGPDFWLRVYTTK